MDLSKTGHGLHSPQPAEPVNIDPRESIPAKQSEPVEIIELSLEEDIDKGNDPYNNTGEQIVLKILEDAKR